jgi:hypothetical protein
MALTKVSTGVVDMSGNTGGLVIAKGNDLERPASPSIGMIRESTETTPSKVEVYTDNSGTPGWQFLEEAGPSFIPLTVDYLIVAGGGGGGRSAFTTGGSSGGGGGAGEYLYKTAQTLTTGGSGYIVTVGYSGNAGVFGVSATNGGNSVFIDTTLGGGYGGTGNNSTYSPGASGGSGGGSGINASTVYAGASSTATSPGLGNAGGASTSASSAYGAGGGGGAGTAGSNGTSSTGGNGGTGVQNSITSTATFYAGGGGGGSFNNNNVGSGGSGVGGNANARAAGSPGTSNTGSGGGGGSYSGSAHTDGASGGSGVVILRYPSAYAINFQTGVGFISSTATLSATSEKVTTITAGSGTITF